MDAVMLITGSGSLVVLSSYPSVTDAALIKKLAAKGINKFIAYTLPLDLVRERYATHFNVIERDLGITEDLRILDFEGFRAFNLFSFKEFGTPSYHEA